MFLRPTKLNFRLKQFGFQPVNATQIHLDNSTSLDQIKDLISISKGCHQFICQNSRTKQKSPEKREWFLAKRSSPAPIMFLEKIIQVLAGFSTIM